MRTIFLTAILCFGLVSVSLSEIVEEETIRVVVTQGDPVEVSNINGDITIEEWNSDDAEVTYVICAETQEEIDAILVDCNTENGIVCTVDFDEDYEGSGHSSVDFLIRVPADVELDYELQFVNGDMILVGGDGSAELELVNGDMIVDDYDGELSIVLVNGEVDVDGAARLKLIEIVNGSITCSIDEILEEIEMASVSGNVILNLSTDAEVEICTISGEIDIDEVFQALVEEDIVGSTAEFGVGEYEIEITTVSGDVEVND